MLKKIVVASMFSTNVLSCYAAESLFVQSDAVKNIRGKVSSVSPAFSAPGKSFIANPNSPLNRPFIGDKTVLSFRADMRVNSKAFDAMEMSVTLSDGKSVTLKRINRYTTYSGSTVWIGKSTNARRGEGNYAENETVLVLRNGRVEGSIRHAGKLYLIHPSFTANHTLAELDTRVQRPDHNDRAYQALPRIVTAKGILSPRAGSTSSKPEISEFDQEMYQAKTATASGNNLLTAAAVTYPSVIRVLINYTPAAKVNIVDPIAYADKLIADTNIMYWNSNVNVRVALAYVEPVSYVETGDSTKDVNNYMNATDGFMDEIHTWRSLYKADLAVLLTGKLSGDICGQASGIGSSSSTAFAIVEAGCATTQYSFAHEIGHLFGARHSEKEVGESLNTVPMYAHGFTTGQSDADRRSIMAKPINNILDKSRRINVFSNPEVKVDVNGVGTVFGTTDVNNNARMLSEHAVELSGFNAAPAIFARNRAWYLLDWTGSDFLVGQYITSNSGMAFEAVPRMETKTITFSDFIVNLDVGAKSKTISATTLNSLVELYIAFFNRVPESNGLYYWIGEVAKGRTINQIAENFYSAAVLRSDLTGYSSTMSNEEFVRIVYKNVLGRNEVDAEGLSYWTTALANGSESRGSLVSSILGAAHSFKNNGSNVAWVADLLDNKRLVGMFFAVQHGLAYKTDDDNIVKGKAIAAAVTATDTSAAIRLIGMNDQQWDFRWF